MSSADTEGWQAVRERVLRRDGYECRFCGVSNDTHQNEHGSGLHAHHIIPAADGGRDLPDNLITVCNSCHRTLEETHGRAVSEMQRQDDYTDDVAALATVFQEYRDRWREYDDKLIEFIKKHPDFAREIGAYIEDDDSARVAELREVAGYGEVGNTDSELRFAAAYGYKEAVGEILSTMDGRASVPWGELAGESDT